MPADNLTTGDSKIRNYDLLGRDLGYSYPDGLNLRPDSDLHRRIVNVIMQRARLSRTALSPRYDAWKKIDESMMAYTPLDEEEKLVKANDSRKPTSIIVPLSYAIHDTFLTFLAGAFLNNPVFRYDPTGPEDTVPVLALERLIDLQVRRSKMGLSLLTQWSDAIKYGIGTVGIAWDVQRGLIPGTPIGVTDSRVFDESIIYEGNTLDNVNPYTFLPDPNVPAGKVQDGEFVGWISRDNRMKVLEREADSGGRLFNGKYLRAIDGRSSFLERDVYYEKSTSLPYANVVDIIWMYITIIPSEWGLGSSEYPEKWVFAVAGDSIVIAAQPLDLTHNMFPVVSAAPFGDGYSTTPTSLMEVVRGLQETADWMYSTHITNVRKSINDMLVVDPMMVNMNDLKRPDKAGGLIRLRKSAWGRGVQNAVAQLKVQDVTTEHVQDTLVINDMMQRVTGASDIMQGIPRKQPERLSASEARATQVQAASRMAKMARIISMQSMQDIAIILAMQTQQLMENDVAVSLIGRYGEDLSKEFGIESQSVTVSYKDIQIPFDVVVGDQLQLGNESPDVWTQILQIVLSQPQVFQELDPVRIFKHAARVAGAKNLSEFERKPGSVQVAPDQQVQQQAQAGNLVPISGGQ